MVDILGRNRLPPVMHGKRQHLRKIAAIGCQSVRRDISLGLKIDSEQLYLLI